MLDYEWITYLRNINIVSICVRLLLCLICGGAIGFERAKRGRAAGFRTHILVCLSSALIVMTGFFCIQYFSLSSDPLRMGAQVVSGIGFLGVGTIMITGRTHITGLTTAAGLWSTAAIGLAIGAGFYEATIIFTVLLVLCMSYLHKIERLVMTKVAEINIYIEIDGITNVNSTIRSIRELGYSIRHVQITPAKSNIPNNIGVEASLYIPNDKKSDEILDAIKTDHKEIIVIIETT